MFGSAGLVLLGSVAGAQTSGPVPYQPSSTPSLVTTPPTAIPGTVSDVEAENLRMALAAAKSGDVSRARMAMSSLQDPVARKIALWALVDSSAEAMSFFELDSARRDLAGWPRAARRESAAEKQLSVSGLSPAQTIAWFGGGQPATAEGAMALASAYQASGRNQDAVDLIRRTWR
ncbi:MAG: lytic transglycosylase, partial [Caulobacter sp. 35-67-4]